MYLCIRVHAHIFRFDLNLVLNKMYQCMKLVRTASGEFSSCNPQIKLIMLKNGQKRCTFKLLFLILRFNFNIIEAVKN